MVTNRTNKAIKAKNEDSGWTFSNTGPCEGKRLNMDGPWPLSNNLDTRSASWGLWHRPAQWPRERLITILGFSFIFWEMRITVWLHLLYRVLVKIRETTRMPETRRNLKMLQKPKRNIRIFSFKLKNNAFYLSFFSSKSIIFLTETDTFHRPLVGNNWGGKQTFAQALFNLGSKLIYWFPTASLWLWKEMFLCGLSWLFSELLQWKSFSWGTVSTQQHRDTWVQSGRGATARPSMLWVWLWFALTGFNPDFGFAAHSTPLASYLWKTKAIRMLH